MTTTTKLTTRAVASAAVMLAALGAAAFPYSGAPITGKVVDADTGSPLEGVNVVAQWAMEEPRSRRYAGDLLIMEAVTDGNGEYRLPAWGPLDPPPGAYPGQRLAQELDPSIRFFRRDYYPHAVTNGFGHNPKDVLDRGAPLRTSKWDGKTIQLKKFQGDIKEYALLVSHSFGGLSLRRCQWKNIPRAIVTMTREKERLAKQGVHTGPITIRDLDNDPAKPCGDVNRFFEEYLK